MPYLNTLSAAAVSRAAAEKTHQEYTLYPGLVEAKTVEMLLSDAQAATAWSNIFNDNKKRSVAAASPLGRNVAKAIHQFLTETACILDSFQHAKVLMQHKSKTASFLRSEAGCAEQPPHRDFIDWKCTVEQRQKPVGCILFLQRATQTNGSRIKFHIVIDGKKCERIVHGNEGDLLVFSGADC